MASMNIAIEAAKRWDRRKKTREKNQTLLANGRVAEVETPERLKLRLDRLSRAASGGPAAPQEGADPRSSTSGGPGTLVVLEPGTPPRAGRTLPSLVDTVGIERVIGTADFVGVNFLELALAVSRFVGRVNIRHSPGRSSGFGTGFMVSPRLLLTNNHVLGSPQEALHSQVEFDYQYDRFGRLLPVQTFGFLPSEFFLTSPELDFTLVAVQEMSSLGVSLRRYGWTRLIEAQGKALLGESLNIIQHPNGDVKQVVLRSNHLVDLFDDFAHYITDTERGSSGSPVYNDQWELVALHHSGVPRLVDGQPVMKDGSFWSPDKDVEDLDWIANEGIRTSSLVKAIKEAHLDDSHASRLRNDLLDLEPPDPLETAYLAAESDGQHTPASPTTSSSSARITLTIPLEIDLRFGAPRIDGLPTGTDVTVQVSVNGQQPSPEPPVTGPEPAPAPEPHVPPEPAPSPEEPGADTRSLPSILYYDEAGDALALEAYYASIQPDLPPAELYTALNRLLTDTHTRHNSYHPATHLYPWVDLHEKADGTRKLKSIYSGKEFDPQEFIEADLAIDAARRRLAETLARESSFSVLGAQAQLDLLEASLPYNCEHVVPQSWFGKREPMRGDLHHLFACESNCNSFRSNIPYFDFPDFMEVVRDDCGKRDGERFEPVANKGAVARATLYFLLRYPGEINRTSKEYTEDRVVMLLDWHRSSPVTRYEQHRNAAIFEKQGNRNPLIDHPDWADCIDFTLGLGS